MRLISSSPTPAPTSSSSPPAGSPCNTADQAFANKLLVLIDGRSVYNPLTSGVDWNAVNVPPEDIDRIEVISGPGATLWGANAVNGVINIITRKSYQTLGSRVDVTAGTEDSSATVRLGGRINDDLTVRGYVRELLIGDLATETGARAGDHAARTQGGFRFDWTPSSTDALAARLGVQAVIAVALERGLTGYAYGFEAWGDLQVTNWWRLSGGVDLLSKHLRFEPGASGLLGVAQAGDDPAVQGSLRSAMDIDRNLTFDAEFRSVGDLPDPFVPAYSELNLSLYWNLTRHVTLGVAGFNLLHKFHTEFTPPQALAIPRSGQIELRARF